MVTVAFMCPGGPDHRRDDVLGRVSRSLRMVGLTRTRLAGRCVGVLAGVVLVVLVSAAPAPASGSAFVRAFGTFDVASLQHPTGVAVSGSGDVYVADQYNNRIVEFSQ